MIDSVHTDDTICPEPSLCHRLRKHIAGRDWEIWTGKYVHAPLDPAERQRIIDGWERSSLALPTLEKQRDQARKDAKDPKKQLRRLRPPSRWMKLRNFARSVVWHIIHGLPTASPADVAKRAAICGPCEWNQGGECIQCGCPTSPKRLLANKLKWAKEKCPLLGSTHQGTWWGEVEGENVLARAWRWIRRIV